MKSFYQIAWIHTFKEYLHWTSEPLNQISSDLFTWFVDWDVFIIKVFKIDFSGSIERDSSLINEIKRWHLCSFVHLTLNPKVSNTSVQYQFILSIRLPNPLVAEYYGFTSEVRISASELVGSFFTCSSVFVFPTHYQSNFWWILI